MSVHQQVVHDMGIPLLEITILVFSESRPSSKKRPHTSSMIAVRIEEVTFFSYNSYSPI